MVLRSCDWKAFDCVLSVGSYENGTSLDPSSCAVYPLSALYRFCDVHLETRKKAHGSRKLTPFKRYPNKLPIADRSLVYTVVTA